MAMAVRKTPLMQLLWKAHPWLYRVSGGRIGGTMMGMPVLLLTTTGHKSGEPRTVALMYLSDGERSIVIASYAGEPTHPGWWKNLQKNPRATITRGGETIPVVAREAEGEEREAIWKRLLAVNDTYDVYASRTTRRIPVVVLEPAS